MPITLLYGNDDLGISERIAKIGSIFADPTTADMNTARFEGKSWDDIALNNAINAMPFLSSQRIVIIASPSSRYSHPEHRKKFLAYIETAPESTHVIITDYVENKKTDEEKHWLVKWAGKNKDITVGRFMRPTEAEMQGWIVNETKKQGGSISRDAAARLAEMIGDQTRQASQEIIKLLTYVNFAREIKVEDVEKVSIVTAKVSVFDLIDAITQRNGKLAIKLLHRFLEDEDEFQFFGLLVSQFRSMLVARELIDERKNRNEAIAAIGGHPYRAGKIYDQARNFDMPTLESIHHRFLKMDEAAKTGQMKLDLSLETFVIELTR
jgi:DNA polymerase-3 subunit delta